MFCRVCNTQTGMYFLKVHLDLVVKSYIFIDNVFLAEWHRVIQSMGGDDVRKWPVQIRHPHSDSSNSGAGAGSTSDMGLMTERALGLAGSGPASPSPSSSSFGGRGKTSAYKSGADMTSSLNRRQGAATNHMLAAEPSKGAFKWVHSISLLSVRVDQSLQIVSTTDGTSMSSTSYTWLKWIVSLIAFLSMCKDTLLLF